MSSRLLDGSELSVECRGHCGAADTRAVEVLEGDESGLDARSLLGVGVTGGEADCNRRAEKRKVSENGM